MSKKITNPVELLIEEGDIVKRYKVTEAIEIVRCRTFIYLHATGFFVVSKPTLANNLHGGALFETLKWYCDYMDKRDEYNAEDQEQYDTICAMIINALTLPLDIFTNQDFMVDVSNEIIKKRNAYYERLQKEAAEPRKDTLEDELANIAFEAEVMAGEQVKEDLAKLGEKQNGNGDKQ